MAETCRKANDKDKNRQRDHQKDYTCNLPADTAILSMCGHEMIELCPRFVFESLFVCCTFVLFSSMPCCGLPFRQVELPNAVLVFRILHDCNESGFWVYMTPNELQLGGIMVDDGQTTQARSCEKARVSARAIEVTRKDATIIHCFCLRTGSIYRTKLIAYVRDDFEMTERSEAKFVKCRSQRLDSSEPIREAEFSMTRKSWAVSV